MREEGAPGAEFCFTGALQDYVEVVWEVGEEVEDCGQEAGCWCRYCG